MKTMKTILHKYKLCQTYEERRKGIQGLKKFVPHVFRRRNGYLFDLVFHSFGCKAPFDVYCLEDEKIVKILLGIQPNNFFTVKGNVVIETPRGYFNQRTRKNLTIGDRIVLSKS